MPFISKVRGKVESLNAGREPQTGGSHAGDRFDTTESHPRDNPYSPLLRETRTRIVVLQPGWKQSDRLHASLEVVDLADNPVYEAASYAWGSPRFTDKGIYINGRDIPIRYNLWAFIQNLFDDSRPRRLWIDALSIRQDTPEKSHQVSLIASIFNQASHVTIWLGECEQNSHLLYEGWPRSANDEDKKRVWSDFIDREYFKRRWCIQEVLLAKEITVNCGGNEMLWEMLEGRVQYAKLKSSDPPLYLLDCDYVIEETPSNHLFFELLKLRRQNVRRLPLLELMGIFEDARCTTPIDKVFAFLAIDKPLHYQNVIEPDYEMSFEQLFIKVFDERLESWRPGLHQSTQVRDLSRVFDLDSKQVEDIQRALLQRNKAVLARKLHRRENSDSSLDEDPESDGEPGLTFIPLRTGAAARLIDNTSSC